MQKNDDAKDLAAAYYRGRDADDQYKDKEGTGSTSAGQSLAAMGGGGADNLESAARRRKKKKRAVSSAQGR